MRDQALALGQFNDLYLRLIDVAPGQVLLRRVSSSMCRKRKSSVWIKAPIK